MMNKTDEKNDRQSGGLRRQIVTYIFFGVLTTLVSFGVFYAILSFGSTILLIIRPDKYGEASMALYTAAQVVSWVCAVLFAFFTNKKYVFTDSEHGSIPRQLSSFAAGRLLTLVLDYVITLQVKFLIDPFFPGSEGNHLSILIAKGIASVVVLVCNYLISRLLVFRRKKDGNVDGGAE